MFAKVAYISILLVFLFAAINGQNGIGCGNPGGCAHGQVRINAIVDYRGKYLGGCNCACNPHLGDPLSSIYCNPNTHTVNIHGDCSCIIKSQQQQPQPQPQQPSNIGGPQSLPPIPIYTNQPIQIPGGIQLPNYPHPLPPINPSNPNPNPPLPPVPTIYIAPRPFEAICDSPGATKPCGCPIGHVGECHILCGGGTSLDACKDSLLECNNDGYPCYVTCMMENSCSGSTSIMGPANAPLTVDCFGDKSCEGSTQFNAEVGTDLIVQCDGMTSCKGAQFNFGKGVSQIACNGDPDACLSSFWNLLPGARTMEGAAFECIGQSCPQNAPDPFSNVVGGPIGGGCRAAGNCACTRGLNEACNLKCDGTSDACKDGIIECNSDGYDCVVDCISMNSCSGAAIIKGPKGASLTVNCLGEKSCEGSVTFDATQSTDTTFNCLGNEACKGSSVIFNMGNGRNSVSCSGHPDACKDAQFNIPSGAVSFSCAGINCPVQPVQPIQTIQPVQPVQPVPIQTIQPAVPQQPIQTVQPVPQQPVQPVQPIRTIQPVQPVPQQPIQPVQPVQPVQPMQPYLPPSAPTGKGSPYCCLTSIPGFKPWRGICWDETTRDGCLAEPATRCAWDENNCLSNPPVNSVGIQCAFAHVICVYDSDCCSETCNADHTCR